MIWKANILLSFDDYKDQAFESDTSNCTYCGKLCINPFLRKKGKKEQGNKPQGKGLHGCV
jgi:hypothetical protein